MATRGDVNLGSGEKRGRQEGQRGEEGKKRPGHMYNR
jgi:hypothetical protein